VEPSYQSFLRAYTVVRIADPGKKEGTFCFDEQSVNEHGKWYVKICTSLVMKHSVEITQDDILPFILIIKYYSVGRVKNTKPTS
jgi:hypothetical protein